MSEKNSNPEIKNGMKDSATAADSTQEKTHVIGNGPHPDSPNIISGQAGTEIQDVAISNDRQTTKAEVKSMLSAIEALKGSEAKSRWIKELDKHKSEAITNSAADNAELLLQKQKMESEKADSENKDRKRVGTVRTFRSDLQSLMQKNKLSLAKIAAIESDRRRNVKTELKRQKKQESAFSYSLLAGAIVVMTTVTVGSLIFISFKNSQQTGADSNVIGLDNKVSLNSGIIFTEDRVRIDITNKTPIYILNIISAARDSKKIEGILGDIVEFELVNKTANSYTRLSSVDFVKMFYTSAPDTFIETLGPRYMLGVHMTDKGRNPFVILSTDSYQYAFSAMLNWEPNLEADLGLFLEPNIPSGNFIYDKNGVSRFQDIVLKNYNLRVLKDKAGKIKLLYGFVGHDRIVISNSLRTFVEIANRISINKNNAI